MNADLRRRIEGLGPDLNPDMMKQSQAMFAATCRPPDPQTHIARDLAYGPDARHRLDVFRRAETSGAPVLVFVHGGGFVMGDKRMPDLPFYDNVGEFAARSGMAGVTITYRRAPDHKWPSGPQDLALAVQFLRANIADHGGDPDRIFLMGQSAGAVHVASYVAHPQFHPQGGAGIAGALLISCIYDVAAAHANPFHRAYFGEDESLYPACSSTAGLIATDIPWMATVSEFDIADFQLQAAGMAAAYSAHRRAYPPLLWLAGHNHLTPALQIGSPDSALEPAILDFIAARTA